ncbi:hypothetical protein [Noviherbaspirillum saxi]|nr:hypothetical protein [Noviherbaspirillum saxi]
MDSNDDIDDRLDLTAHFETDGKSPQILREVLKSRGVVLVDSLCG